MAFIQDYEQTVQASPTNRPQTFVNLSQNENGRQLIFHIIGVSIPAGSIATLSGTKPDGVVYSTTGTIDGDFVTIAEDTQMTAVAGAWDAKIHIVNGGNEIASALVRFVIEKDPVDAGAIPSDSQLDGIVAECQAYAEAARSSAYGSPLTAATAAAMIDQTRVYVYTGSETGYTAGHWYYYDGSAWTDGGTYNSAAIQTDPTLAIPGMAADSKAVGDAIAAEAAERAADIDDVKEDLSEYTLDIGYINLADNSTYISAITVNAAYRTVTLNVMPGETVTVKGIGGAGAARLWGTADIDGKIIRRAAASASGEFTITIDDNEAFFVFNTSYRGTFYCKQEGVVTLIGKAIGVLNETADDVRQNAEDIQNNAVKIGHINTENKSGKMPYISAYMKSLSTTNYIAVVFPSDVLQTTGNRLAFDAYCKDDVAVYASLYNVDLTQTGNSRITTSLRGQTYTSTKLDNWYSYSNDSYGSISTPSGQYVALLFNLVRTDNIKTITEAYFKNIIINDTLIDSVIKEVFLYSADPTANDTVDLIDIDIISLLEATKKNNASMIGDGKILLIGDSLTAGVYAIDETVHSENYPYYMKQIIANAVVNKGMPGYSASMYWNNSVLSPSDFSDVKHIIIMLGTNGGLTDTLDTDVFAYTDYADYADTKTGCYCKIIEYCMEQAPNAQIYLCTTPYHNHDLQPNFDPPYTPDANIVIPKIAEFYHFQIIDVRNGMGINDKNTLLFQSDGLHGDSEFYQKLGTFIGSQLKAKASYIMN